MEYLQYAIIPIVVPLAIGYLYKVQKDSSRKILGILLTTLVLAAFIPLYPIAGDVGRLTSIIQFIFNYHYQSFWVMYPSYLLALVLLIFSGKNKMLFLLSLFSFIVGFIASWFGFLSEGSVMFETAVYSYKIFGLAANLSSLVFFIINFFIPLFSLLFYILLSTSEKTLINYEKNYQKKQIELRKIGIMRQIIPMAIVLIVLVIYTVMSFTIYNWYVCLGKIDCQSWGTFLEKTALFSLSGFFFLMVVGIAYGKGSLPSEAKGAKYLIIPLLIVFLLGNYLSYHRYFITEAGHIISEDLFSEWAGGHRKLNISLDSVKGYSFSTYQRSGKCKLGNTYLVLNDDNYIELSTLMTGDMAFLNYLKSQGKVYIKKSELMKCE